MGGDEDYIMECEWHCQPKKAGTLTRFADDMVIYAETETQASMIYQIVSAFLAERGLRPNPSKSYIVHINEGFDFLGRHYQKIKDVLTVTPSGDSVKEFKSTLEILILNSHATYRSLIETINSKLQRWADSHCSIDSYMVFRDLDAFVEGLLIRKMCDRHPHWSKEAAHKLRMVFRDVMNEFAIGNPTTCCFDARGNAASCKRR